MERFSLTVLKNSTFGVAAQIIIKVLSFIFSVLIIRNLGADDFGQYAAVLAFTGTFAILSDLGLGVYSIRQIARWRDQPEGLEKARDLYSNILSLRILLAFLTIFVLTAAAWLTGRPIMLVGAIALNAFSLILYGFQGSGEAVLMGFERIDITSGARVLNQLAFVIVGAAALWLGLGYFGLIIANLIGVLMMGFACWRGVANLGIFPQRIRLSTWLPLIRASLPFGVIGFALGLSYKFDSVLLNIFRSNTETGYYNAAYNLIFSLLIFSNALNTALYPSLTRQAVSAPQKLPQIYGRILRYLMVLSLPIAIGVSILANQMVLFLYENEFMPAVPALQILIWVLPLMYTSEFLGYVVLIADKEDRVARAVLISTAFNVIVNSFLVPRYGFIAASIMTVLTEMILVSQYIWSIKSLIHQIDLNKTFLRPLIAAIIMGLVVLLVHSQLSLIVNVALGGAVYLGSLLLLGVIGKDELRFIRAIRMPDKESLVP